MGAKDSLHRELPLKLDEMEKLVPQSGMIEVGHGIVLSVQSRHVLWEAAYISACKYVCILLTHFHKYGQKLVSNCLFEYLQKLS